MDRALPLEVMEDLLISETKEHKLESEQLQEMLLELMEDLWETKQHNSAVLAVEDPSDSVTREDKDFLEAFKEPLVIPSLEVLQVAATSGFGDEEGEDSTTVNSEDAEQTTTFGGFGDVSGGGLFTNANRRLVQNTVEQIELNAGGHYLRK
uniref:Uncharacterized protein n=1 Tax=Anopheles epiroticus TaxID=199890 RepID=A0A182PER5_9DIPT